MTFHELNTSFLVSTQSPYPSNRRTVRPPFTAEYAGHLSLARLQHLEYEHCSRCSAQICQAPLYPNSFSLIISFNPHQLTQHSTYLQPCFTKQKTGMWRDEAARTNPDSNFRWLFLLLQLLFF